MLYNKNSLVELVAGRVQPRRDKLNMDRFLKNSVLNKTQLPNKLKERQLFNPVEVPLLDLLAVDSDQMDSWNVPDRKCIKQMQEN